jgi:hypothetical protein
MEQAAKNGIVEGLGKLGLRMVLNQLDIFTFDVEPEGTVEPVQIEQPVQIPDRVFDSNIVKLDTFARCISFGLPVGIFETLAGAFGNFAKYGKMPVKTLEYGLRDVPGVVGDDCIRHQLSGCLA